MPQMRLNRYPWFYWDAPLIASVDELPEEDVARRRGAASSRRRASESGWKTAVNQRLRRHLFSSHWIGPDNNNNRWFIHQKPNCFTLPRVIDSAQPPPPLPSASQLPSSTLACRPSSRPPFTLPGCYGSAGATRRGGAPSNLDFLSIENIPSMHDP